MPFFFLTKGLIGFVPNFLKYEDVKKYISFEASVLEVRDGFV
jgi:hypothetical protein